MKTEKQWTGVSSDRRAKGEGDGLSPMAGRWGVGVDVTINRPYERTDGPVSRKGPSPHPAKPRRPEPHD